MKRPRLLSIVIAAFLVALAPANVAADSSGPGNTEKNVALGKAATASAALFDTNSPRNAVDGDLSNWWSAGDNAPQWIEIDLGRDYDVTGVRLWTAQSPDGDTLHRVLGRADGEEMWSALTAFEGFTRDFEPLTQSAATLGGPGAVWAQLRYVRIVTDSSPSWVAWREIEVFARGADTTGANLALGKTTIASATLSDDHSPAKAVDGDLTNWWSSGDFAPQWIEIDLGRDYAVTGVRLWTAQYPVGRTVHNVVGRSENGALSTFTTYWTFDGLTSDFQPLAQNALTAGGPISAWAPIRYVRITTDVSPSWIAWREIEVFGRLPSP